MSDAPERRVPAYRRPEDMQNFTNPPIGTIVQWFPQADVTIDPTLVSAAMVTAHEGAGIVTLTMFIRNSNIQFKYGVRHVSDPFHVQKKENTMRAGGWDYLPEHVPDRWPPASRRTVETAKK